MENRSWTVIPSDFLIDTHYSGPRRKGRRAEIYVAILRGIDASKHSLDRDACRPLRSERSKTESVNCRLIPRKNPQNR